ncbi:hypothetical protein B0H14DRAFT_3909162 [Mycena olivaceomarginata]|nr:hypothetical protein B0H14DRAFT_3909162 [Mycena olivaceomarginata]
MSLSSLLLAAGPKKIDSELDALFKSNPAPPSCTCTSAPPTKKTKNRGSYPRPSRKEKKKKQSQPDPSPPKIAKQAAKPKPAKKSKRAEPVVEMDVDSDGSDEDDDEDNSDLENAYLGKLRPKNLLLLLRRTLKTKTLKMQVMIPPATTPTQKIPTPTLPHQCTNPSPNACAPNPVKRQKSSRRTKPVQRDARTLFVGGLPAEVAQKRVAAEAEAEGDAKKAYLTPAQKKKILFQGAFHPEAKSVSAYVVLAHQAPRAQQARLARAANASEFMGRVLRVDVCARLPLADAGAGAGAAGAGAGANEDPKLSIFLGNLDFASTESDVREFFEGVGERWVQTVRLIRDRETQLGKGFGYISFVVGPRMVDEILALGKTDEGKKKLKFAKRIAGAALQIQLHRAPPVRGDPTLGARLAHLDKDARKAAKRRIQASSGGREEASSGGREEEGGADPGRE